MTATDMLAEAEAAFLSKDRWRDPVQHLTLADWLAERGRPREAALRRILVEPSDDRHRLDFARLLEREAENAHAELDGLQAEIMTLDQVTRRTPYGDEGGLRSLMRLASRYDVVRLQEKELTHAAESDAARAEFVRVQVELGRRPNLPNGCCHACQGEPGHHHPECPLETLRRRESELLYRFGAEWSVPVAAALGLPIRRADNESNVRYQHHGHSGGGTFETPTREHPGWSWRRGFVAALTLRAADLLRHAAGVFAAAPVEEVTLSNREPTWRVRQGGGAPGELAYLWYGTGTGEAGASRIYTPVAGYLNPARQLWASAAAGFGPHAYATAQEARADLSAAAVAWGRAAAHLPPLPACGPAAE